MTTHRALIGLLLSVTTVACAVQLDEPPNGTFTPDEPGTAGSGAGGATSLSKGGSTSSAGNTSSGGTTSSGGKGGTTSSGGKGGTTSNGGHTGGGSGGSDGGSTNGGSTNGGSGGGTVSVSCAGLPEWVAESNPNPAIQPGEAFTYMDQKYVLAAAMPVTYWNGECPPEASRPTWCETNYAFTGPTPCE